MVHVHTHYCPYTPPPPVYVLYGRPLALYIMCFFLFPRNLDIMKYTKLTLFFNFVVPPLEKDLQLWHFCFCCWICTNEAGVDLVGVELFMSDLPETLGKLCTCTKFSHQVIRWNFGILCNECNSKFYSSSFAKYI